MKRLLRIFAIETLCLHLASTFAAGLTFDKGLTTLLTAGFFLAVVSLIVKPIINLLLLPINLLTFNLFRWVSTAVTLYIVTLLVSDFKVTHFLMSEFPGKLISIPTIELSGPLAYIGFSFITSFLTGIVYWLVRPSAE